MKPRLVVVSYATRYRHAPRGERTRALIEALAPAWEVVLEEGRPAARPDRRGSTLRRPWRALRARLAAPVRIDGHDAEAKRDFRRWRPAGDLALLIGWPFSPLFAAQRRLASRGIPYVVDVGDPLVLTKGGSRPVTGAAAWRAARLETRLWRGAAGAILTTASQATALSELFPELPMLVRPNGYLPGAHAPSVGRRPPPQELRLAYFGHYWPDVHVDCRWFFEQLVESGLWRSISVDQYVDDYALLPRVLPDGIRFQRLDHPVPWSEAARTAAAYHLAFMVGARRGLQLPSKTVHYLSLPVRRLAVVESVKEDAVSSYLAGKRGWLIADRHEPKLAESVADHARRPLAAGELDPPPEEAWPRVIGEIEAFLSDRLESARRSALGGSSPAQPPQLR